MMDDGAAVAIERALGRRVESLRPLPGGCVARVYRAVLAGGRPGEPAAVVAKAGDASSALDVEGYMLGVLAGHGLPVPRVLHGSPSLLVMEFVEGESRFGPAEERHAADLLAALHERAPAGGRFGLERDTLIGSLVQPNAWSASWVEFFRDRRLRHMADEAARAGCLSARTRGRIEMLAERLGDLIAEPSRPSLIHGDVWTTNVLARGGRIVAFLDPAVYVAHAEVELAFITLFSTFGRAFFDRYAERRPIEPGFFEVRRQVYNLYPLLVHARLFGGGYEAEVAGTLGRLGF